MGGIDRTENDFVTKWIGEALELRETLMRLSQQELIELFHGNSGGLPRLARWLAKIILTPDNLMNPTFSLDFRTYQSLCAKRKEGIAA